MAREVDPDETLEALTHAFHVTVEQVAGGLSVGSRLSAGAASIRTTDGSSYLVVTLGGDRERVENLAFQIKDLVESVRGGGEGVSSFVKDGR